MRRRGDRRGVRRGVGTYCGRRRCAGSRSSSEPWRLRGGIEGGWAGTGLRQKAGGRNWSWRRMEEKETAEGFAPPKNDFRLGRDLASHSAGPTRASRSGISTTHRSGTPHARRLQAICNFSPMCAIRLHTFCAPPKDMLCRNNAPGQRPFLRVYPDLMTSFAYGFHMPLRCQRARQCRRH